MLSDFLHTYEHLVINKYPPALPAQRQKKGYSLRPVREASALDCASCFAGALIHINNRNNMLKRIQPFSQRKERR